MKRKIFFMIIITMLICLLPVEKAGAVNYHEIEIDINIDEVILSYYSYNFLNGHQIVKK